MKKIFAPVIGALCILVVSTDVKAMERQWFPNWCWVAAVQDLLVQAGSYQPQPAVAARLTGWPYDRPASIGEVVWLLQSYGFPAWQAGSPGSPEQLRGTLSSGWKLIAFVRPSSGPVGHYIVLQGLEPSSGAILTSDPLTGSTFLTSVPALYQMWHWADSVVVGAPPWLAERRSYPSRPQPLGALGIEMMGQNDIGSFDPD